MKLITLAVNVVAFHLLRLPSILAVRPIRSHDAEANLNELLHLTDNELYNWQNKWKRDIQLNWNNTINDNVRCDVSSTCLEVIESMINNPFEEKWVASIIDANAKLPSGLLSGTFSSFGDFDQCLATRGQFRGKPVVGNYCLATFSPPRAKRFQTVSLELSPPWLAKTIQLWHDNDNYFHSVLGVCFPSACTSQEVKTLISSYYPILQEINFDLQYCQTSNDSPPMDTSLWMAFYLLVLACTLVAAGTVVDLVLSPGCYGHRYIVCFSLVSNISRLFHIDLAPAKSKEEEAERRRFQFIHGLRAISSWFILIAHNGAFVMIHYKMNVLYYARHPKDMIDTSRMLIVQPFFNGALVIFLFFMISGMLTFYHSASPKRPKVSFVQHVLLRVLRFYPLIIGSNLFISLLTLLGSGPLFHRDNLYNFTTACYQQLPYDFLFAKNTESLAVSCNSYSWYLSTEMQLHILSFVLLVLYTRSRWYTYLASLGLSCLGAVLALIVLSVLRLTKLVAVQILVYTQEDFQKADDIGWWFFFAPWAQAIPFFMGTFLGQLLLDGKVRPLSIGWSRTLSWLAGVIVLLVPINTYYDSQSMESVTKGNDFSETIPLIIACILFCLSIFWFLYQSLASPSNWLTKFFGAKIFQPFSRISFSLYMCHWYPIWYNVANIRNPINLANMHELMKIITMNFVHTFLLALLLHVTFEAPSVRLLKLFFLKPPPATLVHKMTGEVNKQPKHGATTESFLHVDQVRRRGVPGK